MLLRRALALALALALPSPAAAALSVKGKASVLVDGVADAKYDLKPSAWDTPLALDDKALKIAFTAKDDGPVAPQQAVVVFEDVERPGQDVTLQVGVKQNGKASFTLSGISPPEPLQHTSGHLKLHLVVSDGQTGTNLPLGEVTLPASSLLPASATRHNPQRAGEPAFAPRPEITHTFQTPAKEIHEVSAWAGVFAVVYPWGVLVALVGTLWPSLKFTTPPVMMYAFLACLVALEGLILRYWIGWRLYQLLPPFLGLAAITAYVGTVALRAQRVQRLKAGGAP